MISKRLENLRTIMAQHDIQAVMIPTSDFHDTEYVCPHFMARAWFSGFTGSAGTLVVLADGKGGLWTDGRYFIQAAAQLKGSGITLMKMGEPDTPSIEQYLVDHLQPGQNVSVDGRCISFAQYEKLKKELSAHDIHLVTNLDLPGEAWPERPDLPASRTFPYEETYTGESLTSKLSRVREAMKEAGATHHVLNKVDEIAWLLNLRADDIPCFPVALCYFILSDDTGTLYIDSSRLDETSAAILADNNIQVKDYDAVYEDAARLEGPVLMQKSFINSLIGSSVKEPIWKEDPIVLMKSIKNPVEMEGARKAHIKDGAAVVKFWKWLEENLGKMEITEVSAAKKLQEFRAEQPGYLEDSFDTIAAYGSNAAMPHYHPDESHPVLIEPEGLFLVDSGGQYLDGTTDITRTFVVGDLSERQKDAFTRVLQGHIDLADARFLYGCRGTNLDILARVPLWNAMMDFNHGTGHGVGALSNVHEAPNGFRWKIVPERNDSCILEEGMITSNEPGLYLEGEFGIRHENLMLTRKDVKNEYGQFMRHEILTMVPFDVRGLNYQQMTGRQKEWLNEYHETVYQTLLPLLNEEEALWLRKKTLPIE